LSLVRGFTLIGSSRLLVKRFMVEVCGLLRKKHYSTFQKSKSAEHKRIRGTLGIEVELFDGNLQIHKS
jgi:hypothetical protein